MRNLSIIFTIALMVIGCGSHASWVLQSKFVILLEDRTSPEEIVDELHKLAEHEGFSFKNSPLKVDNRDVFRVVLLKKNIKVVAMNFMNEKRFDIDIHSSDKSPDWQIAREKLLATFSSRSDVKVFEGSLQDQPEFQPPRKLP
jgi:hypothetical protein